MPNDADSIFGKVGEKLKLRRPALHAIILHCGTKSDRITPPNILKDSYTRFFAESPTLSQLADSSTQIQALCYYITGVYPVLILWWVVYAIFLL